MWDDGSTRAYKTRYGIRLKPDCWLHPFICQVSDQPYAFSSVAQALHELQVRAMKLGVAHFNAEIVSLTEPKTPSLIIDRVLK